jgi:hypothetical protein
VPGKDRRRWRNGLVRTHRPGFHPCFSERARFLLGAGSRLAAKAGRPSPADEERRSRQAFCLAMPFHAVRGAIRDGPARGRDRSWSVGGRSSSAWPAAHDRRHRAPPAAGGGGPVRPGAGGRRPDGSSHSADSSTLFQARRTLPLIAPLGRRSRRSSRALRGCPMARKRRPSSGRRPAGPRAQKGP